MFNKTTRGYSGWVDSDKIIENAINEMKFPADKEASIIAIGTGFAGKMLGAPASKIYQVFKTCKKTLNLYMQ